MGSPPLRGGPCPRGEYAKGQQKLAERGVGQAGPSLCLKRHGGRRKANGSDALLHHRCRDITCALSKCYSVFPAPLLTAASTAMHPGWLSLLLLSTVTPGAGAFSRELLKCFEDPQYEEMVQLAKDGLGQTAERKSIVVIGAGMAGLTVAKTLQDAGHQVHSGCRRPLRWGGGEKQVGCPPKLEQAMGLGV